MTEIKPKTAYLTFEYTLSVADFLKEWNEWNFEIEPTQEKYDDWCRADAQAIFQGMMSEDIDSYVCLRDNNV